MALDPEKIDQATFTSTLSRYPDVLPTELKTLTTFRSEELPGIIEKRKSSKEGAYVTKDELVKLVEWKL